MDNIPKWLENLDDEDINFIKKAQIAPIHTEKIISPSIT